MEIHFNLLVHPLRLSISLQVACHTWIRFDFNHGVELLHESGHKLGALIAHNFMWDSMVMEYLVPEDLRCTQTCKVNSDSFNQCPFRKFVNDNKDGIVSMGEG